MVEDQGLYASPCGYCKSNAPTSFAYGLWAHSLSTYDYQELLDQSWRRSGMFLYRPELEKSCCPAYTIRLKVDSFQKSKEHVRAMCRMQRYLDGIYTGPSMKEEEHRVAKLVSKNHLKPQCETGNMEVDCKNTNCRIFCKKFKKEKQKLAEMDDTAKILSAEIHHAIKDCISYGEYPASVEIPNIIVQRVQQPCSKRGMNTQNVEVLYTCSVAFSCAAALLKHKHDCKIVSNASIQHAGVHKVEDKSVLGKVAVQLADIIALKLQNHDKMTSIRVEACNGHLNFSLTVLDSWRTTKSCTTTSIVDSKSRQSTGVSGPIKSLQPLGGTFAKHKLEIRTRKSSFDAEEFALYRRYQMAVHHENAEDVTENTFRRFLVDTPLIFVPPSEEGASFCGFGSFHQQYLIDGRLVAVGVIDILPSCLSSNYFFWDPDLAFLSLGKYSALKEIEWVQEAKRYCQSLQFYYLGHYIHSCPKMHYKVAYRPSELLCPVRFQWVPFDVAHPLLDKHPYVCLSDSLHVAATEKKDENFWKEENSCAVVDKNDSSRRTTDMDVNEAGIPRINGVLLNVEEASSSIDGENISSVLLKIDNQYMQFKHLQTWIKVPTENLDALMSNLRNYTKVVGASLAARMAYALV